MLRPEKMAEAVTASRADFARVFLEAQAERASLQPRVEFEAVVANVADGSDREAFAEALRFAEVEGFAAQLAVAIAHESLENGDIMRHLLESARAGTAGPAELQAITDFVQGLSEPNVDVRGRIRAARWTVQIRVDGSPAGTGVLIRPHLVLTAWHVVEPLFSKLGGTKRAPIPDIGNRLKVQFDHVMRLVQQGAALAPGNVLEIEAANTDWCVVFSPCHPEELQKRLPDDLSELKDYWDYCVFKLARTPGLERGWLELDRSAIVPKPSSYMLVYQHAGGQSMRLGSGPLSAPEAAAAHAVPALRFLHTVNTTNGSSGGPCFDRSFLLFGLHQGVWPAPVNLMQPVVNRGVPIRPIIDHLKKAVPKLPDPERQYIFRIPEKDGYHPVVGCDAFQDVVWEMSTAKAIKLLLILGDGQAGKTFRMGVLDAMMPSTAHLKIMLPAGDISKLGAEALARRIAREAGVEDLVIQSAEQNGSAATTWVRDEVCRRLLDALAKVRGGRRVWICLCDLNKTNIEGEQAPDLLHAIYASTLGPDGEWLRVVLDGMLGDLPAILGPVIRRHRVEYADVDVLKGHVRACIERLLIAEKAEPNVVAINYAVRDVIRSFEASRWSDPPKATQDLPVFVLEELAEYDRMVGLP